MNINELVKVNHPSLIYDSMCITVGSVEWITEGEVRALGVDTNKYLNTEYDTSIYDSGHDIYIPIIELLTLNETPYKTASHRVLLYSVERQRFCLDRCNNLYLARLQRTYDGNSASTLPHLKVTDHYRANMHHLTSRCIDDDMVKIMHTYCNDPIIEIGIKSKKGVVKTNFIQDMSLQTNELQFINYILATFVKHAKCICTKVGSNYELLAI